MRADRQGYRAYLLSPEWAERRQERLRHDGQRCTGCGCDGSDSRLEVHHLTYERLGWERLEDLVTLCHVCHCAEHGHTPFAGIAPPLAPPEEAERIKAARERDDALRREAARARRRRNRDERKAARAR